MKDGDVLAELRAWRDEFARTYGYDLHAMATALRELDSAAGRSVVRGEPRRSESTKPADMATPNLVLPLAGVVSSGASGLQPLPAAPVAE